MEIDDFEEDEHNKNHKVNINKKSEERRKIVSK